jgi:hypothetical protein
VRFFHRSFILLQVNISGAKHGVEATGVRAASGPAAKHAHQQQQYKSSGNKGPVRLRLSSQQDDATDAGDDDGGNVLETPSPRVREVTETNDSCGYDYPKGGGNEHQYTCMA